MNQKIGVYHIGARSGTVGFPLGTSVDSDLTHVLFDADSDCIPQINSTSKWWKNRIVLPLAISREDGQGKLFLTFDPNMSSLLRPIKNLGLMYPYPGSKYDYNFDEALKIIEEREIKLNSLDSILLSNPEIPKPRFLSIDTQGTELNILFGAKNSLPDINGVLIEVAFEKLYENQSSFCEIDSFLKGEGFVLMKIYPGPSAFKNPSSISNRGEGQLVYADALYFRRPEYSSDLESLAFIALSFGFPDFARNSLPSHFHGTSKLGELLSEFKTIVMTSSQSHLLQFHEIYNKESSKERYALPSIHDKSQEAKIESVIKLLRMLHVYKIGRKVYRIFGFFNKLILQPIKASMRELRSSQLLLFARKHNLKFLEDELNRYRRRN